jgi:hypothetical protein
MKYVVRGEKATFHPGAREKSYWPVDEHPVTVHDVRPIRDSLAFDRNGFVLVDEPTDVTAFTDQDELARYCRQTEALVQRLTGADKVVSFGPMLRTNAAGAHGHNQPAHGAHVDYGAPHRGRPDPRDAARRRGRARLAGRHMLINVWRPIVMDESTPLACATRARCGARTCSTASRRGLGDFTAARCGFTHRVPARAPLTGCRTCTVGSARVQAVRQRSRRCPAHRRIARSRIPTRRRTPRRAERPRCGRSRTWS